MSTCRFCKQDESPGGFPLVKYGVRHYAHADCGLAAYDGAGFLDKLTDWQCTQFPYLAAVKHGPATRADLQLRCDRYAAAEAERVE